MRRVPTTSLRTIRFVLLLLALLLLLPLAACGSGDDVVDGDADLDGDVDWPLPVDGDGNIPGEQPQPSGEPDLAFYFGTTVQTLSDWPVYDDAASADGASDWRVLPLGLKQVADLTATRSPAPDPQQSHLVSTELRYARRNVNPSFIELTLTPGSEAGGFGISTDDGLSEVLVCLDEDACGSRFVRWQQSGSTLGLAPVGGLSGSDTLTLLVSTVGGYGMVSVNGQLLLSVYLQSMDLRRMGILLYLFDTAVLSSLKVWGEVGPELARPNPQADVIGLRGFGPSGEGTLWPENTLVAFQQALSAGASGVLADVRMSNDDVAVLIADASLDRTTDCSGQIKETSWQALSQCVIKTDHALPGQDLRIPRLDVLLEAITRAEIWLRLYDSNDEVVNHAMVGKVMDAVLAAGALSRVVFLSESIENLRYARTLNGGARTVWLVEVGGDSPLQFADENGFGGVAIPDLAFQKTDIANGHTLGLTLTVYDVHAAPRMKELVELGVDALLTARPDRGVALSWDAE
jgi:glycerophosphoryl diester phosphodiesterase